MPSIVQQPGVRPLHHPTVGHNLQALTLALHDLQGNLENQEKRRVLQQLTQIGGVQRYTDELRQALADA